MKKVVIVLALLFAYGCVLLCYYPHLDDLFGYKEFNDPESKDAPAFYISLIFVVFTTGLLLFFVNKNGYNFLTSLFLLVLDIIKGNETDVKVN